MNDSVEVYITSDYSVKLDRVDILFIADDVRLALYEMPRPDDYTVTDILTKTNTIVRMYIEDKITRDTEEKYCYCDLDNKKRTEADYWQVIKLVLGEIEVIAK